LSYRAALPTSLDKVKRITLAVKGDESYHKLYLLLEAKGIVYRASKPFILEMDGWKDAVWQFEKPTRREWDHIQLLPDPSARSQVIAPNEVRLTLSLVKSPYGLAVYRKFVRNYVESFKFVAFFRLLMNTVILTGLNILGQLFSCSIIAYGFARLRWPGRDAVFVLLLATMMLPGQVTMIPQFLIWRTLGMYDTFQPLWMPSLFGSGFYIFLLRQFFLTIPTDLEDAARIDGCGFFGIYWRIMLPLIKPALAAIAIFQFMGSWNEFMGPLIYISSEHLTPLSLGLFMLRSAHTAEWGMLMAASTMMTLPVIMLFFFTQRYFIQGVTLTGMKE
jgi:multiple sugar transport system permease protein